MTPDNWKKDAKLDAKEKGCKRKRTQKKKEQKEKERKRKKTQKKKGAKRKKKKRRVDDFHESRHEAKARIMRPAYIMPV